MSKIEDWKQAKSKLAHALQYIGMIGKRQPYTTAKADGYLHSIVVKTQVHFQPSDGAANYHESSAFDSALQQIIKRDFDRLAGDAIALLKDSAAEAGRDARAEVEQMLSEIGAAEEDAA